MWRGQGGSRERKAATGWWESARVRVNTTGPPGVGSLALPIARTRRGSRSDSLALAMPSTGILRFTSIIDFRSPDRNVWCILGRQYSRLAWCGSVERSRKSTSSHHSAEITRRGKVRLCAVAHPSFQHLCFQQFISTGTVLPYGQHRETADVRCTSAHNGITCIKLTKPGKGSGFRVKRGQAVRVERNLGPGRLAIPPRHATRSSSPPAASPPAVAPGSRSGEAARFSLAAATRSPPRARAGSRSG